MTKVLSLDISTKTGFALIHIEGESISLVEYGLLKSAGKPEALYPEDYLQWAKENASLVTKKIEEVDPDIVVIEETAKGSKNNFSQKILEWTHYLVADFLIEQQYDSKYFMTGEWRVLVEARMTKDEQKRNAKRLRIKQKTGSKIAKDEVGKIVGRVTKKHVNVRVANERFGLQLKIKDNDVADAILLGAAYFELTKKQL
jgi:Holliday junction resolvasome RuvABC endonuclease subunit